MSPRLDQGILSAIGANIGARSHEPPPGSGETAAEGERRMEEDWRARAATGRPRRTTFVDQDGWTAFSEFKAGITGRKGEQAVRSALAHLGLVGLHDVILADRRGLTQIDHIVRAGSSLVALETKMLSGRVSGTPLDRQWVQQIGTDPNTVVTKFQNPLLQNVRHIRAVEAVVTPFGVPVFGHVVLAGSAAVSEELRPVVMTIDQLAELVSVGDREKADNFSAAWQALVTAAAAGEHCREEHAHALRARRAT